MQSIYKNEKAKEKIISLYDEQINKLNIAYKDAFVDTVFGKTHLIECGNLAAKPLLPFHGGNATTAYNLGYCGFLLDDFHIYDVLPQAKLAWEQSNCYMLRGRGHINQLTDKEKEMIVEFLKN